MSRSGANGNFKSQQSRHAVVTEASKCVGRGNTLGLAQAGWNVGVNCSQDRVGAESTAEGVRAVGQQAWLLGADVGYSDQVKSVFRQFIVLADRIDLLVHNAGVQTWRSIL